MFCCRNIQLSVSFNGCFKMTGENEKVLSFKLFRQFLFLLKKDNIHLQLPVCTIHICTSKQKLPFFWHFSEITVWRFIFDKTHHYVTCWEMPNSIQRHGVLKYVSLNNDERFSPGESVERQSPGISAASFWICLLHACHDFQKCLGFVLAVKNTRNMIQFIPGKYFSGQRSFLEFCSIYLDCHPNKICLNSELIRKRIFHVWLYLFLWK